MAYFLLIFVLCAICYFVFWGSLWYNIGRRFLPGNLKNRQDYDFCFVC